MAYFFLDDATRRGLDVVVTSSEAAEPFLRGLHRVLQGCGRMGVLYLDRGPGFVARAVAEVCRRLEVALVLGERRCPEAHGKVERFNRTAEAALLRALDGRPDVDPALPALELRISPWLRELYAHQPHEGLPRAGPRHQTPWERWSADPRALDHVEEGVLREAFVLWHQRRVSADRVVKLSGVSHELPLELAPQGRTRTSVQVAERLPEGTYHVPLPDGRLVRVHPVDLVANARSRRAQHLAGEARHDAPPDPALRTAADLAFLRDLGPVVGDDGGLPESPPPREELP